MLQPKLSVTHIFLFCSLTIGSSICAFATTDTNNTSIKKTSHKYKTTSHAKVGYKEAFDVPVLNSCPQDDKLTLFYQTINQNSPLSYVNNHLCIKNMLSFSGKVSMDFRWYDRYGGLNNLWGVGVRPMFGQRRSQFWGSLNEASLFVDARVNQWLLADMSLTYANASVKSRTSAERESDYRSVYAGPAALKVDEAYLTFAKPDLMPFYIRIGRQYSLFGDYKPYPVTESLTQLLEQSRTGAFVAGVVLANGLYGSVSWSLSKQSISDENIPAGNEVKSLFYHGTVLDRNYGAKLGYQIDTCLANQKFHFNANASWLSDIRDVDYLNEMWFFYEDYASDAQTSFLLTGVEAYMRRQGGAAFHADSTWGPFGAGFDYVTALGELNPNLPQEDSRIYAWGVDVNFSFNLPIKLFCQETMPSVFDIGYQQSNNANVMGEVIYNQQAFNAVVAELGPVGKILPLEYGNILPKYRWIGTYTVNVMRNVSVSAQWVHDVDYPTSEMGSGLSSNIAVLNVTAQF